MTLEQCSGLGNLPALERQTCNLPGAAWCPRQGVLLARTPEHGVILPRQPCIQFSRPSGGPSSSVTRFMTGQVKVEQILVSKAWKVPCTDSPSQSGLGIAMGRHWVPARRLAEAGPSARRVADSRSLARQSQPDSFPATGGHAPTIAPVRRYVTRDCR